MQAVPFIAAAIGGLVVSKVVGKITGSPILGAIAGGFAGFGIGSMISSGMAAGASAGGGTAVTAGGTASSVVPATVSGSAGGGFGEAFSSAFADSAFTGLSNVGGGAATVGGSVAGAGGAGGMTTLASGASAGNAFASSTGAGANAALGGGIANSAPVASGFQVGSAALGTAPGGGIIDKILGSMEKYPGISKIGADFVGGLFETNKSQEYFEAKSEYEKEQRELRSADDKIEGDNVAMAADGIFPEGAVGKQMQLLNKRAAYRGQNRLTPAQNVLPEGELMENYANRKPKVVNSNEEEEKA